jgi:hypothetical protein
MYLMPFTGYSNKYETNVSRLIGTRQLLMILTIAAQCRPRGTIAPSVSKIYIEYRYNPLNII